MKYDKTKVVSGQVYPIKDKYLVFANGCLRMTTEGITCFQDIAPYNQTSGSSIPHAYDGHGGVDVRASIGVPVYAEKDITIKVGVDDWGNKVIVNGFRMRHMDKLPTKTSFKKGEIVFYTGTDHTNAPHLHIGREDGGDTFVTLTEGKPSSSTQYYVNLSPSAGMVGAYAEPGGKKVGDLNPKEYGGLTYTNIGNATHDTSSTYKMAKIKTDSYGYCWVTCEHYEGRSRSTSKTYELVN